MKNRIFVNTSLLKIVSIVYSIFFGFSLFITYPKRNPDDLFGGLIMMVIAIVVIAVLNRLIIGRLHSIETKGVKRVSVSLVSLFFVGFMNFVTLLSNGLHYCGDIWRDIYYMTGVVVCVPLSYNFLAWLMILAVFLVTFLMFIRSIEIVANPEFVKRPSLFQIVAVVIIFVLVFALVLLICIF